MEEAMNAYVDLRRSEGNVHSLMHHTLNYHPNGSCVCPHLYMGDNLISNDMMFYNINDCNYFASRLTRTYGNYRYAQNIPIEKKRTAYCVHP